MVPARSTEGGLAVWRRLFACALAAAVIVAVASPAADAKPRPLELTGCKGECKKTERKCSGDCQKVHSHCAVQCGCPTGKHCTEAQKQCFGLCNVRMDSCVHGCKAASRKCSSKC